MAIVRFSGGEHYSPYYQVRAILSFDSYSFLALIYFCYSAAAGQEMIDEPPPRVVFVQVMNDTV